VQIEFGVIDVNGEELQELRTKMCKTKDFLSDKPTVYIASPFFTPEAVAEVEEMKKLLKVRGFAVFSPKDDNLVARDADEKAKRNGFIRNIVEIEFCDFMVCNTRDKDMGSLLEAGYALAYKKPVIYFCQGLEGDFNLMLAMSGHGVATSYKELEELLSWYSKETREFKKRTKFGGRIE